MTTCKVPGCTSKVRGGHLLCLDHWRAVPFKLQMAVQRTWRNFQQASKPNMRLACLRAYRVARDEAIAAVTPKETANG
jgi:hypothetical protein